MLKIGEKAPDFSLRADDDKTYSLSKLRGRKVVLYFYPKDDTPGCTLEGWLFRDAKGEFDALNAQILGVSRDSIESHKRFSKKYSFNFPLLSDASGKVSSAYGVWRERNFLGRKSMGIERTTFVIDERGRVASIFPKVNPLGHARIVLQALM